MWERIKAFICRPFCQHDYEKIAWREQYDRVREVRYSVRRYKCTKCNKKIWVDGRCDPYSK